MSAAADVILQNFINGEFVASKEYIDSYDPSIGEVYAKVPDSDDDEVGHAGEAAKKAFPAYVKFAIT